MKISKDLLIKLSIITCFLWLCSCTYTQQFDAVLSSKPHPALDSINTKYGFENIDLVGKKTDGSGGKHSSLTIRCINGKDVPVNDDDMSALAKQIATLFKAALQNPDQFESYTVLFVQKTTDGDKTTTKYVGHEFKPGEIQ